jgi:hypothetical protein
MTTPLLSLAKYTPSCTRRRICTEETRKKISKANKGKRLGYAPWNKGRKLHYITGKREHTEETRKKMSEAAKRRWAPISTRRLISINTPSLSNT